MYCEKKFLSQTQMQDGRIFKSSPVFSFLKIFLDCDINN
jgi:hypothetical protein